MDENLNYQERELYMQELMDNYNNPRNFGVIKDDCFIIKKKNTTCGDSFDLYVQLNNSNLIKDIKFNGEGCAISTASFSLLTQKIKGLKIEDVKKINEKDIKKMIGIPISYSRLNCAMLSFNALQEFIDKYNLRDNK
ncbi:MAG: iron-sulfur cluster assembly scaffold protein [Nanoarchaeota archaeon]